MRNRRNTYNPAARKLEEIKIVAGAGLVVLAIIVGLVLLGFPGLYAQQSYMDIKLIVEEQGYNEPVLEASHPFAPGWSGCSSEDAIAYSVSAKAIPAELEAPERTVDLAVCCGTGLTRWSKGCTVRVR